MRAPLIIAICILAATGFSQTHVRFIATGDDRWETNNHRPGMDENGVNVGAMRKLAAAIVEDKPDVLLFNGDTIGGGTDEEEASQYKTFLGVMRPIYDAKIHVLVVRGNHEMRAPHASQLWRDTFSGPLANPSNGPAGEEDMTFSYEIGNTLFLGLDQFMTPKPTVNQAWIDKTIAESKATHIFAFAHKMAFKAGSHTDGMNTIPAERDAFLDSITSRGETVFFAGHDHMYDHVSAAKSGWAPGKLLHQIVCGTAGAPFYHASSTEATDGNWTLTHVNHIEQKLGYAVVDVDGPKVTVVFKAESATEPGKFEAVETFSYVNGS